MKLHTIYFKKGIYDVITSDLYDDKYTRIKTFKSFQNLQKHLVTLDCFKCVFYSKMSRTIQTNKLLVGGFVVDDILKDNVLNDLYTDYSEVIFSFNYE